MKTPERSRFSKLVAYLLDPQGKETRVGEINITNCISKSFVLIYLRLRAEIRDTSTGKCSPIPRRVVFLIHGRNARLAESFITTPELQKKTKMRFGLRNFAGWNALYSV